MIKGGIAGNTLANSNIMEGVMKGVVTRLHSDLSFNTGYNVTWKSNVSLPMIAATMVDPFYDGPMSTSPSTIKPDGGILSVTADGFEMPILISEAKYQDSKGNAWERAFKNIRLCEILLYDEEIFPYLCFCQGKGFVNQAIINQICTANWGASPNETHLFKIDGHPQASFYMQEEAFDPDVMYKIAYDMADSAIKHYSTTFTLDTNE